MTDGKGWPFANPVLTASGCGGSGRDLAAYGDLIAFVRQAGALDAADARRLARAGGGGRAEAAAVLERARALRESLHGIFAALAAGRRPPAEALSGLNAELGIALAHACVSLRDGAYALAWKDPAAALDRPLWPIARSAMELLLELDPDRIGECESETCGFLFLDTTRNRSRRWCDTRICGNRARVRRHRRRRSDGEG